MNISEPYCLPNEYLIKLRKQKMEMLLHLSIYIYKKWNYLLVICFTKQTPIILFFLYF